MNFFDDKEIARQIIIDRYRSPLHLGFITGDYVTIKANVESCIDNFNIQILLKEKIVINARMEGAGCAVATASNDILLDLIIGKSISEIKKIMNNFLLMLDGKSYEKELLEEGNVFQTIYKHANRINCAKTGCMAIKFFIENK